jgi:hypothetical protein
MVSRPNQPLLVLLTGHLLSLIGSGLVTTAVILRLFVVPSSARGPVSNPNIGIIVFIDLPIMFFAGLALIPIGVWCFEPAIPKRSRGGCRLSEGVVASVVCRKRRAGLQVALLMVTLPLALHAEEVDCLSCHADKSLQNAAGQSVAVDAQKFKASIHGALSCTDCHTGIQDYPHPEHPAPARCDSCHADEVAAVRGSVHASASAHLCTDCHGDAHAITSKDNPQSPVYALNVPRTCGSCHGNPALARKHGLTNVYAMYIDSIHGFALSKEGLLVAANCSSCHGTHRILSQTDPRSSTYRSNIPDTCGTCHAGIKADYLSGAHGKALEAGNPKAPVCTDCHTAHQISAPRQVAFQVRTTATCGTCHREKLTTYRDTFHAQVSALGYSEVARCWDCHGEHRVLPASDPRSPINRANLIATCGKCHSRANANFVSYRPHANARDRSSNPALYFIRVFMNVLLWSVLGFFALHTMLWFIRSRFPNRK